MRTEKDTLVEQLREAVRGREREKALELLKKGALDGVTQEQRQEICTYADLERAAASFERRGRGW